MPKARPALKKKAERLREEYGTTEAAVEAEVSNAKSALRDFIDKAGSADLGSNALSSGVAAMASLNYSGSTGDFSSAREVINLQGKFMQIVGTDPEDYGSPLFRRVQINTLSGFILCEHAHFQLSLGMISEAEAIETFMERGFFYE